MDSQVLTTKDKVNRTSAAIGGVLIMTGIILYLSDDFMARQLLYPIFLVQVLPF